MKVTERARGAASAWSALDIVTQYALAATAVIVTGMAIFGYWVANRIESGVVQHAAANSALHFDSFIQPLVQDLATSDELSPAAKAAIQALESHALRGQSVRAISIWNKQGKLVFSTSGSPAAAASADCISRALAGNVASTFEKPGFFLSNGLEPRLKICAPLHTTGDVDLIAVAQIEEDAAGLAAEVNKSRFEAASLLTLLSILMAGSLFGIVRNGARTIAQQKNSLAARVSELSRLLEQNSELQRSVLDATRRSTDLNDRLLKRISAELHDGPVQLIALALLRLEGVKPAPSTDGARTHEEEFETIENVLRDALKEIRGMSSGLALPQLEKGSIGQAIEFAVRNHERRTRTRVKLEVEHTIPKQAGKLFLTCVYRFIQEGLNNAFRHANGKDQTVRAYMDNGELVVEVRDGGPGFTEKPVTDDNKGLGLPGLSDRVATLGGQFDIASLPGGGTCLKARFGQEALLVPEL